MQTALTFIVGLVLGAAIVYVAHRLSAAEPSRSGGTGRVRSLSPVTDLLGQWSAEPRDFSDDRFSGLQAQFLGDALSPMTASAAGIWVVRDDAWPPPSDAGVLERQVAVGEHGLLTEIEPAVAPMLAWSAREGVVQFGPDGELPIVLAAPLATDAPGQPAVVAFVYALPVRGDQRAWLKADALRWARRLAVVGELVKNHDALARANRRTRSLLRAAERWGVGERPDELGVQLCAAIEELTNADGAALLRWDANSRTGSVVVAAGTCQRFAASVVEEDSLAGAACRENVPKLWHDVGGEGGGEGAAPLFAQAQPEAEGCVLIHPLRSRGGVIGAVLAANAVPGSFGVSELRALALFDAVASFRIASAWKLEELSRRVIVDGLTGLHNREGFEQEMREAYEEHARFGWEVSLALLDLDNFKHVNDTYGHETGDRVLREVAAVLQDEVRATDVCARVGGDEMAIILKDTGGTGAHELADRIRAAVAGLRIDTGASELRVTASVGIVTYPTEVADWEALYRRADEAMYARKSAGREIA